MKDMCYEVRRAPGLKKRKRKRAFLFPQFAPACELTAEGLGDANMKRGLWRLLLAALASTVAGEGTTHVRACTESPSGCVRCGDAQRTRSMCVPQAPVLRVGGSAGCPRLNPKP